MKSYFIYFLSAFLLFLSCTKEVKGHKTTSYYLIRHAEKDRSDINNPDPHLNDLGLQRAEKWANTLKHIPFDEIYSTNYNRTIETVQTIAKQRQKEINIYDPENFDLTNFLTMTIGKTVLIVGHSNTIPGLVNKIIKKDKYDQIKDYNNSNLYIICRQKGVTYDTLLVID